MAVTVTAGFTSEDIRKRMNAFLSEVRRQQIRSLQYLGEQCVTYARSVPKERGFEDQTGNLRSSIGYAIFVDGVAIHSSYEQVKGGAIGVKTGLTLAEKAARDETGICLVVTAGMNYAIRLESKGRDVITGAETMAKRELPKLIEQLRTNILKASDDD